MLDCDWSKALLARLILTIPAALACAATACGQAAAEYAMKSSGSALSAGGGHGSIGACRVDATLLTCLSHSYPKTTIAVIALVALVIMRQLTRAQAVR